jgi:Lipopolysaccharide-assembly
MRVRSPFRLLLAGALAMAGCGYQQNDNYEQQADPSGYQWRSLYRQDVQTVAVPIFTTQSFRRGVELRLSKALVNQLESQTPYKVVARERADTIIEGEITDVGLAEISSHYDTGIPQEQLVTVTVNFVWKDLRTGQILVERRGFEQTATYYPTLGEGEFAGSQLAAERLALGIVQELQADW